MEQWNVSYGTGYHAGIDLVGDQTIYASAFGKVILRQPDNGGDHGMGNTIIIEHNLANGYKIYSLYAHLKNFSVELGKWVKQGQAIGVMGKTGPTPAVHLHFEIKLRNLLHNPLGEKVCFYPAPDYCGCNSYCWGYTPENPDKYGYRNPYDYFGKDHILTAFLAKAEGSSNVFWIQNGKRYRVINADIIQKMSDISTWGEIATYQSDVIDQFETAPDFINSSPTSDGLLIRENNTSPVYIIENGTRRHISFEEFNQSGYDWNDVIIVSREIMLLFDDMGRVQLTQFHHNNDTYSVYCRYYGTRDVSSVNITGPANSGLTNEPLYDDGQHIDIGPNDGVFSNTLFYLPGRPNIGDVYIFEIVKDGQIYELDDSISGIIDTFATLISPSGVTDSTLPTFQWTPTPNALSSYHQQIVVFPNGTNGASWVPRPTRWIWSKVLPFVDSVTYNNDGTAKEDLTPGNTYYWQVRTLDENWNSAWTYQMEFIVPAP